MFIIKQYYFVETSNLPYINGLLMNHKEFIVARMYGQLSMGAYFELLRIALAFGRGLFWRFVLFSFANFG